MYFIKLFSKVIILIILLIPSINYAQIKINNVREGYYVVYDSDSIKIDDRATELEAQQSLTNYQLRTGKVGYWIPPRYRVDITGTPTASREIEIDTIIGTLLAELDDTNKSATHIDYSRAGTEIHSAEYYISLKGENLFMPVIADTIEPWLTLIELKRTKSFGETTLERIGTPFQHKAFWIEEFSNIYRFRIQTTDFCQAYYVMERQDWFEVSFSKMEFSFDYTDHGINITDLDPGTTYKIWSYVIDQDGTKRTDGPIVYTVPEDDVRPLVGFQFYIVYFLDNTITSNSIKIRTWTTEDCSIQLKLGTTPYDLVDYPTDTGINASHPNDYYQHGRWFENLEPDTTYYWQAINTNISGNTIESSIHVFKTLKL